MPQAASTKLTPIQRCALDGLRQHAPHGVPAPRTLQHYNGTYYAAVSVQSALAGLARRNPPLCWSYTENGQRRYQLNEAGEKALAAAEGK